MPKAQHSKAASFVRQNLFAGVMTFTELEKRVAALPDKQSRGDAFEVFAEAYLATQRKHDAANVWPLTAAPTQILKKLGLEARDYGVDGVFKTLLGSFSAYQVKFRTNRPALTWRELSTFMGLADSPQITSRVLLTNCDELPLVLNERQGFFCIRGSDFDRLEADNFRAIEAWLADVAFVAPKKQPRRHQTEALDALLPALETHDRVTAIMACGTGKTLVALWVAERRQASRILVLLPSLALLRQVLHEWLRESSLPSLAYLCVCSDPTVKDSLDSIATVQSDLDFQVSTNTASVRDFLDEPFSGTKVVFSTYQSAQVVGAALKPGEAFDFAVFDEAHKTAGREGRNFAFALEDVNLPIRKRLFLTATPRHYNPLRRDGEGDAQIVFSMDRSDVYGPQAYCLTFADAAKRGIICGYKVVISVITSERVTNELLSRGDVLVNGDAVRSIQVANQIALRDAIKKYSTNKVFTFHRTVASAASFVADGNEGIHAHLPEFETFHVNGTMPTACREREMRDFRAAPRALMSNARCLTEGVDVPAVDMVAFLSPRRSRVDIVQATGRAMRRSPDKTIGYVLVPLFVEQSASESIEAAVSRSKFDGVWDVLHSLQEQDDVLAEIIKTMAVEMGRTGHVDIGFGNRVEVVGHRMSLADLQRAITARCLLGLAESWDVRLGELLEYRRLNGDCRVPQKHKLYLRLASWVNTQRRLFHDKLLSADRIGKLAQIGFEWDPYEADWQGMFQQFLNYKENHGTSHIPDNCPENPDLGRWVTRQRMAFTRGALPKDKIKLLKSVDFIWDRRESVWEMRHSSLRQYHAENGNCVVPVVYPRDPQLGWWVDQQRYLRKKGRLSQDRIRRLNALSFVWHPMDAELQEMYNALHIYKKEHGNSRVPQLFKENPKLGRWVARQRAAYARKRLPMDRIKKLGEMGFEWVLRDWHEKFAILKSYQQKHGELYVPKPCENSALAQWASRQRRAYKDKKLSAICIRKLNAIGFSWKIRRRSAKG